MGGWTKRQRCAWLTPVGQQLTDLILPGTCCLCDGEVPQYRQMRVICEPCTAKLAAAGEKCRRCSAAVPVGHRDRLPNCPWCQHLRLPFDSVTAVANYEEILKKAVLQAKTRTGAAAAWDLGQLLAAELRHELAETRPPIVVPVPMHWLRRLRRGMSTTRVLAESIRRATGWPVARLVRCRRALQKQSELSSTARKQNVRNAFQVKGFVPSDVPLVLVDDIMTTGATLAELARVLRKAGADQVHVAVVARSAPHHLDV